MSEALHLLTHTIKTLLKNQDDWYINLICVTKYQGVEVYVYGLSSNHTYVEETLLMQLALKMAGDTVSALN